MTEFDHAEYARNNRHRFSQYGMDSRLQLRLEMVEAYGRVCKECGEDDPIVLVLDHINDDAFVEKELYGVNARGGHKIYSVLKQQGWPQDRFQLLCCNCNARKEFHRRRAASIARNTNPEAFEKQAPSNRGGKMKRSRSNTSGIKGVFWNTQQSKWNARILVNYKTEHLGFYDDIRDAARAYAARAREVWGTDANVATEDEIEAAYAAQTQNAVTELSTVELGL